jgi:hypothetical protein
MTDTERLALVEGDRVMVRDDQGTEKEFVVKYPPWQLGHGEWVIGLHGKAGGYLLGRVVRKVEAGAA